MDFAGVSMGGTDAAAIVLGCCSGAGIVRAGGPPTGLLDTTFEAGEFDAASLGGWMPGGYVPSGAVEADLG